MFEVAFCEFYKFVFFFVLLYSKFLFYIVTIFSYIVLNQMIFGQKLKVHRKIQYIATELYFYNLNRNESFLESKYESLFRKTVLLEKI